MRKIAAASLMLLFLAAGAFAQVRGTGRLRGEITDKATGKPIAGATITISLPSGNTSPIKVKSDSHGRWAALGMTEGQWNIDISAPGYATSRGTAHVSELGQTPSIDIQMQPEVKQEPAAPVPVAPSIPKEAVEAIKEGEQFLKAKAGDVITTAQTDTAGTSTAVSHTVTADELKSNAQKAVEDFNKALPMIGEDKPELVDVKNQVYQVLAQAYYKAGDVPNAITTLETLNQRDPMPATPDAVHITRNVLLANLYLENGQLDKGRALLDTLPASAITDPTAYINIGILFLNKKNPADSIAYFTKAIDMDPKQADGYYYRGLAELQLKKNKEAKADFQQVLALSPDSSEGHDAKQLLANMK